MLRAGLAICCPRRRRSPMRFRPFQGSKGLKHTVVAIGDTVLGIDEHLPETLAPFFNVPTSYDDMTVVAVIVVMQNGLPGTLTPPMPAERTDGGIFCTSTGSANLQGFL
jgi:hypothetical protein